MEAFNLWLGISIGVIFSLIVTWIVFDWWESDEDDLKRWLVIFSIALLFIAMGTLYIHYNPPEDKHEVAGLSRFGDAGAVVIFRASFPAASFDLKGILDVAPCKNIQSEAEDS